MKKKLLILFSAGTMGFLNLPAQFNVTNLEVEVQHADVSIIDIDGDGDRDIVVSGEQPRLLKVLLNDGFGNFTAMATPPPFTPVTRTTFDWNDLNGDGKLDVIESGFSEGPPFVGIYTSDGAGNFTAYNDLALPQTAPSSGFADLNNDGYTDVFVFGNHDINNTRGKIYFNDKIGGFTESLQFEDYRFIDPVVSVVDFDNDGDLDMFISAYEANSNKRFSQIFKNNIGVFTAMDFGIIAKGQGSSVWGDYDGDGYLDLLLNGDGYVNSGEDNDHIYRLYHNDAGTGFTENTTFMNYRQNSTGDGGRFVDWDNDGDLDIIVTGDNKASSQATGIFLNTSGTFTPLAENAMLPGVSESSIEVGDVDTDGDLDLILTGYSNNDFDGEAVVGPYNKNVTLLVKNPATTFNLAPGMPMNLNASGTQAAVTLSWDASLDVSNPDPARGQLTPSASLSYNLFLVNVGSGRWHYYPLSDTISGKLSLQQLGNVQLNESWTVRGLPPGDYRWGVQAIDNSFAGSLFAKSTFTILADGSLPVVLKSFTATPEGKKARIEWSTASEYNNDRFEIQRSSDGRKFFELATVKGNGTTTKTSNYFAYDNNPSSGTNYYRLVQYNLDGVSTDHGIKVVKFGGELVKSSAIVYPNPAAGAPGIRLSNFAGKLVTVTMTDMMGKQIHKETIQADNSQGYYQLHLKNKPVSGQYILLVSGEGLKETLKVIMK